MPSPAAEIEVDEALLRSMLETQHPDLATLPLCELDAGWDNTLWRIGDALVARLPRRAVALDFAANEQRWLPILGPHLPLPVPIPVRLGRPADGYPWPWSIVRWLEGTPGDRGEIDRADVVARQLAEFLRALHQIAPRSAPRNPYRGGPIEDRIETFEERAEELASEIDVPSLRAVWDRACDAAPWTGPRVWIHGDLHPANVLLADGVLAAVLDFGDMCGGDPATDLAAAWMLLPQRAIPVFIRAYGDVGNDLLARALGWAVVFGLLLLAIGLDDRPTYQPIGRRTLANSAAWFA